MYIYIYTYIYIYIYIYVGKYATTYEHILRVVAFDLELIERCPKPPWKSVYTVCWGFHHTKQMQFTTNPHQVHFLKNHMISWEFLIWLLGQPLKFHDSFEICVLEYFRVASLDPQPCVIL